MTSYVLDAGVFASTQQYSNSISPKASLSYAFEDPAKFGGFGANARINASLTRDYASSVASLTTGQLTGALINGTIQPGAGFVPATWTSTQTYEEWRARIDLQTDYIVGGNAAVSPRLGVTFSSANTAYNLSRIASGINNGNPYTMINASLYGFYLGAALGVDAKVPLGGGFVVSGGRRRRPSRDVDESQRRAGSRPGLAAQESGRPEHRDQLRLASRGQCRGRL